jgi:hypothetical protein
MARLWRAVREKGAATELVKRWRWGADDNWRKRACACEGRSGVVAARVQDGCARTRATRFMERQGSDDPPVSVVLFRSLGCAQRESGSTAYDSATGYRLPPLCRSRRA